MEEIFAILRSRDLVGNPFGFTMGRNYRFFANLKFFSYVIAKFYVIFMYIYNYFNVFH